ncbi:unnamed protein product [Owenia fusiformis]|uniref:AMOP domain-containing protein n=1 Tax=Owenia fusiformis TaxID=6347 RepID=A0A8S4PQA0_OWEFU|nr:unnamed protein product [Owenia fusiformis]
MMSEPKHIVVFFTWASVTIALTLSQSNQEPPRRGNDPDIPESVSNTLKELSDKNASEWCLNWYKEELENPINMTDVLPCAPTSNMARYDRRYERVTSDISRFHPGASVCYVAKEITNAGVQQECCYDSECKLMVGPGADNSSPGRLILWTTHSPDNSYTGQLIPKTTHTLVNLSSRQLVLWTTHPLGNSYPGQLIP